MSGPLWTEARFVFPPGGGDDAKELIPWAEANGFAVTDWCEWERADGATLEIHPEPDPRRSK